MRRENIGKLCEDIRSCTDCKDSIENAGKQTPCVYAAEDPKVLVVSEIPPFKAWNGGLGEKWRNSLDIPVGERVTGTIFLEWLSTAECVLTPEIADKLFFWIQRSNCHTKKRLPNKEKYSIYRHCSKKYIQRAIDVVKPRLIISLGGHAALWFYPRMKLYQLVSNEDYTQYKGYEYYALTHSSPGNIAFPSEKQHGDKHKRSLELVRPIIAELIRELGD